MHSKSILAFSLVLLTSVVFAQDKKTIKFVDNYLNAAFWNVQGTDQPLVKWGDNVDTLMFKVVGQLDFVTEKSWDAFLSEIQSLSGKILIETKIGEYHILIFLGELYEYAKITGAQVPSNSLNRFNNWSSRNWDTNYNLTKTSFCIVPNKMKDKNEAVYRLNKGFLKSMGMLGELDDEFSIFYQYPATSNADLSRDDKRLLKLHYHSAIKSGEDKASLKKALFALPNIDELAKEKL